MFEKLSRAVRTTKFMPLLFAKTLVQNRASIRYYLAGLLAPTEPPIADADVWFHSRCFPL